jgi:hypothetical protein
MEEFLRKCLPTAAKVCGARYVGDSQARGDADGSKRDGSDLLVKERVSGGGVLAGQGRTGQGTRHERVAMCRHCVATRVRLPHSHTPTLTQKINSVTCAECKLWAEEETPRSSGRQTHSST